jgi:hypothetical protein
MDLIDSSLANGQFTFLPVPPWSNVVGVRPALIVTNQISQNCHSPVSNSPPTMICIQEPSEIHAPLKIVLCSQAKTGNNPSPRFLRGQC